MRRSAVPPSADGPTEGDWAAAVAAVRELAPTGKVLLICHVNPDGDALGSMLGFALGLRRLGVESMQATFPGPLEVPEPFGALPGLDLLVPEADAVEDPDLVLCFDAASASRLGAAGRPARPGAGLGGARPPRLQRRGSAGSTSSTRTRRRPRWWPRSCCGRLDVPLDAEIAECLYVALATDTGSFRFDMTTPAVHEMAARLIATGIKPGEISRRIFDTRPFGAVRLFGDVLQPRRRSSRRRPAGTGMVWTYATLDDLARLRPAAVRPGAADRLRCAAPPRPT